MSRPDTLFLVVLLGAAVVGGASLLSVSDSLATQELVPLLEDRVEAEVTDVSVANRSLLVEVRFGNPTATRLAVNGGYFAVFANDSRLAAGSTSLDSPLDLPTRGTARATFRLRLSDEGAAAVRSVLESGGFDLRNRYSVTVDDAQFTLRNDRVRVTPDGRVRVTVEGPE